MSAARRASSSGCAVRSATRRSSPTTERASRWRSIACASPRPSCGPATGAAPATASMSRSSSIGSSQPDGEEATMAHDHDHPHQLDADRAEEVTYHQRLGEAVRELLIEKGVVTADEVRRQIEKMDARSPALGARVVARAWVDPAFKARLLADGSAACRELGIDMGATHLVVVENSAAVHNLVVCTLCSCYPRALLGL